MLLEEEQVTYFARWLKKKKKAYETQNPGNRCRAACVWQAHAPQCSGPAWGLRIHTLGWHLCYCCHAARHSTRGIPSLQQAELWKKSTPQITRAKL